jgi:hypothetical protein
MAAAVSAMGVQMEVVRASDTAAIDAAFAALVRNKTDALVVGTDPFFFTRRVQFATLAARHAIPAGLYCARVPRSRLPDELRHEPRLHEV